MSRSRCAQHSWCPASPVARSGWSYRLYRSWTAIPVNAGRMAKSVKVSRWRPPSQYSEPVQGVGVGRGGQHVLLGPGRAGPQGGLVEPGHDGSGDQRPDQGDHVFDRDSGGGEHRVDEPGRGRRAGHVGDQLGAPGDRDMLEDQQVHHQGPQVRPVTDRGIGDLARTGRDMPSSAPAASGVQVVLHHLRRGQRHLVDLMGADHALVGRVGQVRSAAAHPRRAVSHRLVRDFPPRQPRPRGTGPLAALTPLALPAVRWRPTGCVVPRGRHRGVPAVT